MLREGEPTASGQFMVGGRPTRTNSRHDGKSVAQGELHSGTARPCRPLQSIFEMYIYALPVNFDLDQADRFFCATAGRRAMNRLSTPKGSFEVSPVVQRRRLREDVYIYQYKSTVYYLTPSARPLATPHESHPSAPATCAFCLTPGRQRFAPAATARSPPCPRSGNATGPAFRRVAGPAIPLCPR